MQLKHEKYITQGVVFHNIANLFSIINITKICIYTVLPIIFFFTTRPLPFYSALFTPLALSSTSCNFTASPPSSLYHICKCDHKNNWTMTLTAQPYLLYLVCPSHLVPAYFSCHCIILNAEINSPSLLASLRAINHS